MRGNSDNQRKRSGKPCFTSKRRVTASPKHFYPFASPLSLAKLLSAISACSYASHVFRVTTEWLATICLAQSGVAGVAPLDCHFLRISKEPQNKKKVAFREVFNIRLHEQILNIWAIRCAQDVLKPIWWSPISYYTRFCKTEELGALFSCTDSPGASHPQEEDSNSPHLKDIH